MSAASQRASLVPLPEYHRRGLIILTSFSFLSAAATTLLWLFITYKFLSYRRRKWAHIRRENKQKGNYSTPFPILVYNLLLADMMEAVAYAISIYWVVSDGIIAPSSVCWAQGWLGSTSNLAASLFLTAISVNTFLTVGLGYKLPQWTVYATVAALWVFDFGINGAGVIVSVLHPAAPHESFFMRANVWCWISTAYDSWRLWAHYFWIMVSIAITITLYAFVFYTLWRSGFSSSRRSESQRLTGYHPAFLVYPFVYIGCSVPLVIGRVTSLLGIDLGIYYFAFAGSVLAANGLFNSILWTSTILFSAPQDVHDTGLDRFAFIRTPIRDYGHTVVISGPSSKRVPLAHITPRDDKKDWWWWKHGGMRGWGRSYASMHDMRIVHAVEMHDVPSSRPAEGPYIQMEVVTAVTTEQVKPSTPA
ncbi:hypothetical protein LX32DRAFT_709870 [Colletotrichum zoysiae]|uniref:Integral membrane protein n=1 Tax=Colletotrichum zoysiae TaxID=1216348 RepID=A0AAD9HNQ4_9PEZI|nr:hypothetical protein LX32DRAFT_709870 [Colletotrichum zoysiae]